jgi:hypothetical protein
MNHIGPYINEAKYKSASAYESGIVNKINGVEIDGVMFDRQLERLVDEIRRHPKSPSKLSPAVHTGKQKGGTTAIWVSNGGSEKQDYITDMILNGHKVSLKMGKSQLFKGNKQDTQALIYSVIDSRGHDQEFAKQMGLLLEEFVKGKLSKAETKKYKTIANAKKEIQELMDANEFHTKAKELVRQHFNSNKQLAFDIVQEAMSGNIKFGNGDAAADWLLAADKSGKAVTYNDLYDQSYVSKIASRAKVDINFDSSLLGKKHTMKQRTYQSVFRLASDSISERFDDYEGQVLTENIIGDIFGKMRSIILRFVQTIKEMFNKGISYVMGFLEGGLNLKLSDVDFV